MKVAIVYDRVNKWGGAERVLLTLHEIFPKAALYTSVYDSKNAPWAKIFPSVRTSFLQKIPFAKSNHEFLAPLMPLAFRLFDFSDFDLVISVTSEFAKGIRVGRNTIHICYCLTPTRYIWSHYPEYFKNSVLKNIAGPVVRRLKKLDKMAAKNPDVMVAISSEVRNRIKKYYKRDSKIIYPPVNTKRQRSGHGKYYLVVSRLVKYKKVDLAVKTFNKLYLPLVIIGTGREENYLKKIAGKNIIFAGKVNEKKLSGYYANAKALIMPQEEDFGIVSVEAQSYGVPVIAYKKGGATDTVISGKTGIFFDLQNSESLARAVGVFENTKFKKALLKKNAQRFSKERFKKEILALIRMCLVQYTH